MASLCERWRAWPPPPHAEGSLHPAVAVGALFDWLDKAEAELPAEIEAGRLCEDMPIVYHCVRKWVMDDNLR